MVSNRHVGLPLCVRRNKLTYKGTIAVECTNIHQLRDPYMLSHIGLMVVIHYTNIHQSSHQHKTNFRTVLLRSETTLIPNVPLSVRCHWGFVSPFNLLGMPPCNGVIAQTEICRLLQKYWCPTAIYSCIIQIVL